MRRTRSRFEITLGVFAYILAAAGALIMFWAWGHAMVSVAPAAGGMVLMAAALGVLGCRRLIYGSTGAAPARLWSGVLVVPVLLVATVVLGVSGVALDLRWHGSKSAFQAEVSSLRRGVQPSGSVRIGSYTIDRVDVEGSGYLFDDADGQDLTDCGGGFAFLPGGPPTDAAGDTFVALDGDWYTWTCWS
ncbi:MAG TPA: hypothetical protein VGF84_09305 [Micromonosporaceae bacterium]|jgi:hypothetical protein